MVYSYWSTRLLISQHSAYYTLSLVNGFPPKQRDNVTKEQGLICTKENKKALEQETGNPDLKNKQRKTLHPCSKDREYS